MHPLVISTVKASGNQADFPPQNVIDNNVTTRWANHDPKSSITLDLGKEAELCSVNVSWYIGNEQQLISLFRSLMTVTHSLMSGLTEALKAPQISKGITCMI